MIILKRLRREHELDDHLSDLYHNIYRIYPEDMDWSIKPWEESSVATIGDWIYDEIRRMYPEASSDDVNSDACCVLSMRLHILVHLAGNILNGISVKHEDAEINIKMSELAAMLEVFPQ